MQASDVVTSGIPTPDQLWGLEYLFSCDWSSGTILESAFSTDIVKTLNDNEQRWGLTPVPFRTLSATLSIYGAQNVAKTRNLLARASFARWLVPLYSEEVIMTANGSSMTVFCVLTDKRFFVNQRVALVRFDADHLSPTLLGTALIGSVNSDHLVLDSSTTSYQTGDSIFPLMEADVLLTSSVDVTTDSVLQFSLQATETVGPESTAALQAIGDQSYTGAQTFSGNLILDTIPDFTNTMKLGVVRSGITTQVGLGKVSSLYGTRHRWLYTMNFTELDRASASKLIRLFESLGGRLKPFWLISPTTDLTIVGISATTVTVNAVFNSDDWAFYTHIAVVLLDGTILIKPITSVARVSTHDIITVPTFGTAPSLSAIDRVSFSHLMRLDSDSMKEQWTTDTIMVSSFDCVEVFAEDDITLANISDFVTACTSDHDPDDPAGVPDSDPPPIDPDDPDVFSYSMIAECVADFDMDDPLPVECHIKDGFGAETTALNGASIVVTADILGVPLNLKINPGDSLASSVTIVAFAYGGGNGFLETFYFDTINDGDTINLTCTLTFLSNVLTATCSSVVEVDDMKIVKAASRGGPGITDNFALSGIPANMDGVTTLADGDTVLLKDQTISSENGVWTIHSGSWTGQNAATGVGVLNGTCNGQRIFYLTAALTYTRGVIDEVAKAATTANITLSGTQTIDGQSIAVGDKVLVKNQTTGGDNGLYVCQSSNWTKLGVPEECFVKAGTVNQRVNFILVSGTTYRAAFGVYG